MQRQSAALGLARCCCKLCCIHSPIHSFIHSIDRIRCATCCLLLRHDTVGRQVTFRNNGGVHHIIISAPSLIYLRSSIEIDESTADRLKFFFLFRLLSAVCCDNGAPSKLIKAHTHTHEKLLLLLLLLSCAPCCYCTWLCTQCRTVSYFVGTMCVMCRNIKPITAAAAALRRPTHRSNSGRDVIRYNTQQRWKERKKLLLLLLNDAFAIVQMFILLFLTATAAAAFSVDRKSDCRLLISSQRQRHARTNARTHLLPHIQLPHGDYFSLANCRRRRRRRRLYFFFFFSSHFRPAVTVRLRLPPLSNVLMQRNAMQRRGHHTNTQKKERRGRSESKEEKEVK